MGETWADIAFDTNHIIAEVIWTIAFDGIIVAFLYNLIWKKIVLPKVKKDIHEQIDKEHNITHKESNK
jgi:hypothetical protein